MSSSDETHADEHRPGFFRRILDAIVLPKTVSAFEASYLKRMNKIALAFFWGHLPIFALLAYLNGTGPVQVSLLTLAVLAVPTIACRTMRSDRAKSLVFGFAAMSMGAVLVHLGQGPVQIEMHFYFFASLAMLALFANPMVIIVAAVTVALHHLGLWFLLPESVFNYDAPIWVVLVHAAFVVLETVAACFIARNFFDNVIGLEKKVEAATSEIRERNRDMRVVLDNVRQGLVTIGADASLSSEHSAALEDWFGPYEAGEGFGPYLARSCDKLGAWFDLSWETVTDGFLPLELAIDQLPSKASFDGRHFAFEYEPVLDADGELEKMLVVVSDITADVERAEAESLQREILSIFERILNDRVGFVEFYEEAGRLLAGAQGTRGDDWALTKRQIHTVKGNAGVFGIDSIVEICHVLEDRIAEGDTDELDEQFEALEARWSALSETIDRMLGNQGQDTVVMTGQEYETILRLAVDGADHADIAKGLVDLKLEPTEQRLGRFAEQARALAQRLEKGDLEVAVDGDGLRLERERFADFWASFTHVLRNAIDHGIESPDERRETGKADQGRIDLRTYETGESFVVEVADDGRGIDWSGVAERAEALGLPNQDEQDLVEALFATGLTTKDSVSTTSGRGVGLAAVREACRELGGGVAVDSEIGRGTVVRFSFPLTVAGGTPSNTQWPEAA